MKAFKGFNKDLTCRGSQHEEGKEFETEVVNVCNSGFHAYEYPLDCFDYHHPAQSVYHEVELDGDIDNGNNEESKACATKIKVGAKINIAGMIKCAIDFTMAGVKKEAVSDERNGFASATGYCGASSATGDYSVSSATWEYGASSATGECSVSSATGDYSVSSATGDYSASVAGGVGSIAIAWGAEGKAKGVVGSYLVLADWKRDKKECVCPDSRNLKGAIMVRVDGKNIKADTYYTIIDGMLRRHIQLTTPKGMGLQKFYQDAIIITVKSKEEETMGCLRDLFEGLGVGKEVPAAWSDEYRIIDRLVEYFYDQTNMSRETTNRRWRDGYYTTPIPKEDACKWIEKHKGDICREKLDLARKIYGYKG